MAHGAKTRVFVYNKTCHTISTPTNTSHLQQIGFNRKGECIHPAIVRGRLAVQLMTWRLQPMTPTQLALFEKTF